MQKKIIPILTMLLLVLVAAEVTLAQDCGPGCPACSGKARGDLLPPQNLLTSLLYIPDAEEETTVFRLRYGLFSWMDAGIGYGLDEEVASWSVRVQAIAQDREGWRPALIIGSGSVRTGGNDQSLYIQLAKSVTFLPERLELNLAGGLATDLPGIEENWWLGTLTLTLFDRVSPFYSYDGINPHLGLSCSATEWLTLTGYYLEMETAALAAGIQWNFGE
ncbi:MAG: hypothetical protein ISR91_01675 [Candidatus Delongbacteria bacterium]|nr:hypothetical protein [Candidatus Delongbacteria bacterium]